MGLCRFNLIQDAASIRHVNCAYSSALPEVYVFALDAVELMTLHGVYRTYSYHVFLPPLTTPNVRNIVTSAYKSPISYLEVMGGKFQSGRVDEMRFLPFSSSTLPFQHIYI